MQDDKQETIHVTKPPSPATWDYQPDPEVVEILEETEQTTNDRATPQAEYTAVSPILSGGDVDADWERANAAGEETVGGTVSTPDQDRVDELGEAWGVELQDNEPVNLIEKIEKRDENRWELNPASKAEAAESEPPR